MVRICGEEIDGVNVLKYGSLFVVTLISIVLFGISFDTIERFEIGIRYDGALVDVQERTYPPGRYFVGLGRHFITYNALSRRLNFQGPDGVTGSLRGWSQEGQLVILDINFYYKLKREKLHALYRTFGNGHSFVVRQAAVRIMKEITTKYTATQFFSERRVIRQEMEAALKAKLSSEYFCTLELFNLASVDLPDAFENKIVSKVVQAQQARTATNKAETAIRRANITVVLGAAYADGNLTLAEANANKTQLVQNTQSSRFKTLREQEAVSFESLQSSLGLNASGADGILQYRWSQLFGTLSPDPTSTTPSTRKTKFIVGFNSPLIQVQQN